MADVKFSDFSGGAINFSSLANGDIFPVQTNVGTTNVYGYLTKAQLVTGVNALITTAAANDVTAASTFGTDNRLVRSDGTGRGSQASSVTVDDSGNVSTPGTISAGSSGSGSVGIGTAGVTLADDGAGGLIFTSLAGTLENLKLSLNTANTAVFSSSTGVNLVDFGTGIAVSGALNAYGAGWNGSRKFATEDAVYDKIESLGAGGGLGYMMKLGGSDSAVSPPNGGFTIYMGSSLFQFSTAFNNVRLRVPKAGTIKSLYLRIHVLGTAGSAESVDHKISINGAAATGTGVTVDYSAGSGVIEGFSASEAIAVIAGDYISLVVTTPTWATPPTSVCYEASVYIE